MVLGSVSGVARAWQPGACCRQVNAALHVHSLLYPPGVNSPVRHLGSSRILPLPLPPPRLEQNFIRKKVEERRATSLERRSRAERHNGNQQSGDDLELTGPAKQKKSYPAAKKMGRMLVKANKSGVLEKIAIDIEEKKKSGGFFGGIKEGINSLKDMTDLDDDLAEIGGNAFAMIEGGFSSLADLDGDSVVTSMDWVYYKLENAIAADEGKFLVG